MDYNPGSLIDTVSCTVNIFHIPTFKIYCVIETRGEADRRNKPNIMGFVNLFLFGSVTVPLNGCSLCIVKQNLNAPQIVLEIVLR